MPTAELIKSYWTIFLRNIDTYTSPEKANALKAFYEKHEYRIALMPVSGKFLSQYFPSGLC
jgi:hypothetical protein